MCNKPVYRCSSLSIAPYKLKEHGRGTGILCTGSARTTTAARTSVSTPGTALAPRAPTPTYSTATAPNTHARRRFL
jgi:hypothetical protein